MRSQSQEIELMGYRLHRLVMHPPVTVKLRAVAIFYHGQGDYAERYADVLGVFTQHGIRCIVTDLLGHGRSPGVRGHCGNERLLDAVISSSLAEVGELPYGVMGHSMGGLLAIRHLILAGKGLLPTPAFSWVSSPLVKPGDGLSTWFKKLVSYSAPLFPWLTISTGVTTAMCKVGSEEKNDSDSQVKDQPPLWHRRVSLAWGLFLMQTAEWVEICAAQAVRNTDLILTQGGSDQVCPKGNTKALFDRLGCKNKSYHEIEGMLHEPFSGEGSEQVFEALDEWIRKLQL